MAIAVTPLLMPNESHVLTKNEALVICGKCLAMCYEKDNFDKIKEQSDEQSIKRAMMCIKSGHHSGFEHVKYTFEIIGISKFLAMVLNNMTNYATSEKSARYTVLTFDNEEESKLRDKWQEIFFKIIHDEYYDLFYQFIKKTDLPEEKIVEKVNIAITKKAQENSRNITSIWAKTKMIYTINIRMLSYLVYDLKNFIKTYEDTPLIVRLKKDMKEFIDCVQMYSLDEEGLNPQNKNLSLPFFGNVLEMKEEFGENYSLAYKLSFSAFAQEERHRTINHVIQIPNRKEYFIPELIADKPELVKEWLNDCQAMTKEDSLPQATLIYISERGRYEDFILKCKERLCGSAQYEIAMNTKKQLNKYIKNTVNEKVSAELLRINTGARCTFGYKCTSPCVFGPKYALDRKF